MSRLVFVVCWLAVLPLLGCGTDTDRQPLPRVEAHEFRDLLRTVRAGEFKTFQAHFEPLVRGVLAELPKRLAELQSSHAGVDALLRPVPAGAPPLPLDEVPGPLPFQLPARLEALLDAAFPGAPPEQETARRARLTDLVVEAMCADVSRQIEGIPSSIVNLKAYAPPKNWLLSGERPGDLYGWFRRIQRRPLSKDSAWDRHVGDHLAERPLDWKDADDPVTITLGRAMREVLRIPDSAWAVLVVLKYGSPDRFKGPYRAMLEETFEGIVQLLTERVERSWHRSGIRLDEYLYWEYERGPGEREVPEPAAARGRREPRPPEPAADRMGPGRNFALVFGIDDYEEWPKLANPVRDATTIGEVLKETYGFEVELLKNPTKSELQRRVVAYTKKSFGPSDQLFVFFAGHGTYDEQLDLGYLVLKDSRLDDDLHDGYLAHAALLQLVDRVPCRHILVVLDACFAGSAFERRMQGDSRGGADAVMRDLDIDEMIARKMPLETRKLITSGGTEYVFDGADGAHSPFAYRLIRTLRSVDGHKQGLVTFHRLLAEVEAGRPGAFGGSLAGDSAGSDFLFVKPGPKK